MSATSAPSAGASSAPPTATTVPARRNKLVAFLRAQPLGAAGLFVIIIMVVAAAFPQTLSPYEPEAINFGAMLAPPSWENPLGTDAFGRDILTRIIYGTRTALTIGFLASFIGCSLGALLGIASAFFAGKVDLVLQRIVDIVLSFPIIVLALVVVAVLGKASVAGVDFNLIMAIAIPIVPRSARVVRSAALSVRNMAYIDAAKAGGYSSTHIILRHMAPNVLAPVPHSSDAYIAQAILLEASLSFLGLGVSEPKPAWGLMLAGDSANFYQEAPWMILFPGIAISLAVFAFNLLGDSLRDWLDPRFQT